MLKDKEVYYRHKKYNFAISRESLKRAEGLRGVWVFESVEDRPRPFIPEEELQQPCVKTEVIINPYNIHLDDDYEVVVLEDEEDFSEDELLYLYKVCWKCPDSKDLSIKILSKFNRNHIEHDIEQGMSIVDL